LAVGDQHRNDYRHLSDGVPYSGNPNRDTAALQLKLDELIIATNHARNAVAAIETRPNM
jgi:hypothetical protein